MISLLDLDLLWENSRNPRITYHSVSSPEILAMSSACSDVLRQCPPSASPARNLAWRIYATAISTILPFSDSSLELSAAIDSLAGNAPHEALTAVQRLRAAIGRLSSVEINPKKIALDNIFLETDNSVWIWNRPHNRRALGWPTEAKELLAWEYGGRVKVLSGLHDSDHSLGTLVLTSPLNPRIFDLGASLRIYGRGRTDSVHVLRYPCESEGESDLRIGEMPHGLTFSTAATPWAVSRLPSDGSSSLPHESGEPYVENIFPTDLGNSGVDSDDSIPAVKVAFSDGRFSYFAASALLPKLNGSGLKHFPVEELAPGDCVAIISGESDDFAVHQRADLILKSKGQDRAKLWESVRSWKQILRTCVNRRGLHVIADEIERSGIRLPELSRIEAWSHEDVIGPQSLSTFAALLAAVKNLGFFRDVDDISRYSLSCWSAVEHLRNASRAGGREVSEARTELLEQWLTTAERRAGDTSILDGTGAKGEVLEVDFATFAGNQSRGRVGRLIREEK